MEIEDWTFLISIIFICLCGMILHSIAIRLQILDYDAFIKPIILIALSCSEISVCIVTITLVILPYRISRKMYKSVLPYCYCIKLTYVVLQHILSIDSLLRVRLNIYYNPYKMEKIWQKVISTLVFLILSLIAMHAVFGIHSALFKFGILAESSLIIVIFSIYLYILSLMNNYRVLPISAQKKYRNMLKDLRPTIRSVPMLILITHLPFAGIPNLTFLVFLANGIDVSTRVVHIKFFLSALGLVNDAVFYVFSIPKIRQKIRRKMRRGCGK